MERLLLAAGFWVGGVAAWAPIAGFLLAPHCRNLYYRASTVVCTSVSDDADILDLTEQLDAGAVEVSDAANDATAPSGLTAFEGKLMRPDPAPLSLLTESQRMRLAPIHPLKRKRRSRKIRRAEPKSDKLLPLVPGARQTESEAIIAAYAGDSLSAKQEAGEDYWMDPALLEEEQKRKREAESRRKQFKRKQQNYAEDKLKEELVSPYKQNVIGYIVVAIGVAAVIFSFFPDLLEQEAIIAPKFPDTL